MKKLCLDLCAGLGGFSRAFSEREDWEVITVDMNPKFNTTMVLDLINVVEHPENHRDFWNLTPDVIVASPPCERFSLANTGFPLPGIYSAFRVAGAVMEIIASLRPSRYILENPKGRLRWFMGKPNKTVRLSNFGYRLVKPTDFWTNLDMDYTLDLPFTKVPPDAHNSVLRPALASRRAEMPYALSKLVLESFERVES